MQAYRFGNLEILQDDARFEEMLAHAYKEKDRPHCLCKLPHGVPMYVARFADRHLLKRMPNSGSDHAVDCESFEAPAELSGLGQVLGSAIREDVDEGGTDLRLDFALSKSGPRQAPLPSGTAPDSVRTDGVKLTLRGLVHYLWDEARLNRWTPAMSGRRNWFVVRKHLLEAAADKSSKGLQLTESLYIPETFSVAEKNDIIARRYAKLAPAATQGAKRQLRLLIGEVKAFEPARYGHKIIVRHAPDMPFMVAGDLHKRMDKRFAQELSIFAADPECHLIVAATFGIDLAGYATIDELSLVMTSPNWIPIESLPDLQLVTELTRLSRKFTKGLRYNMAAESPLASAVLTDTPEPVAMYVAPMSASEEQTEVLDDLVAKSKIESWIWHFGEADMPAFPAPAARRPT